MPVDVEVPPIWLLGSSTYSAELAGSVGLGFAFAHHFASVAAEDAIGRYLAGFRPSRWLERPHAILATSVICADTEEEAERLAASADLAAVRRARGSTAPSPARRKPSPTPSRRRRIAGVARTVPACSSATRRGYATGSPPSRRRRARTRSW